MTARAPPRPSAVGVVPSIGSTAMSVSGRRSVADPLAVEQHRGVVLLALADDHDAVHGHRLRAPPAWPRRRRRRRPACRPGPSSGWRPWRRPPWSAPAPWPGCGRAPAGRSPRTRPYRSGPIRPCAARLPAPAAILGAVDRDRGPAQRAALGTVRAGGAKNSALKLMVACLLAEGRTVLSQRPAHRRRGDHGRGAAGPRGPGRAAGRRRSGGDDPGRRRPRPGGPLRPGRAHARLGRRPRTAPGALWRGAHAVARGRRLRRPARSTSTSTACRHGRALRDLPRRGARERRTGAGWSAPGGARVPEPHRHRQPAHGGGRWPRARR